VTQTLVGITAGQYNANREANDRVLLATIVDVCNDAEAVAQGRILPARAVINIKVSDAVSPPPPPPPPAADALVASQRHLGAITRSSSSSSDGQCTLTYTIATSLAGVTYPALTKSVEAATAVPSKPGQKSVFVRVLLQYARSSNPPVLGLYNVSTLPAAVSNLFLAQTAPASSGPSGMALATLIIIAVSVAGFVVFSYSAFHLRKRYCRKSDIPLAYYEDDDVRTTNNSRAPEDNWSGDRGDSYHRHPAYEGVQPRIRRPTYHAGDPHGDVIHNASLTRGDKIPSPAVKGAGVKSGTTGGARLQYAPRADDYDFRESSEYYRDSDDAPPPPPPPGRPPNHHRPGAVHNEL